MLIRMVLAIAHAWTLLLPYKRSLRPVGLSSFTRLGWFRLTPIDQYSSLLPPVGVWTVSQFQCGGTFLSEPLSIVALVGRYPANQLMERMITCNRLPFRRPFMQKTGGMGYQSEFLRVIPLLQTDSIRVTHPCAGRQRISKLIPDAPRLACVRPVASVHPEPGSNSSL